MGAELALRWIHLPAAEFEPARRFLDFVVDDESLFARLEGDDHISCLGWLVEEWDELAAQRLLGRAAPDVEDRVAIWVCTACGDVLCGAVTARVTTTEDEVIWHDFARSYPDHQSGAWVHDTDAFADWEAIRFSAATYSDAIGQRPPTVSQFPVASSGGVVQSIRRRLRHRVG
jgi:hypothetical protein